MAVKVADFSTEQQLHRAGFRYIAGLDEVGRGCLAGPVVAAAVVLDSENLPQGLKDSKQLSAKRREKLYQEICEKALSVSFASVAASRIDSINIRKATLRAMAKAVDLCSLPIDYLLIDGKDKLSSHSHLPQQAIIKGDTSCASIAAASIIAKVTRDNMLIKLSDMLPQYGFDQHVGYGTKQHLAAIMEHGPIAALHRYSFAPMRNFA